MEETVQFIGIGSKVNHSEFGKGVVVDKNIGTFTVWFKNRGEKEIPQADGRLSATDEVAEDAENRISLDEVTFALTQVLRRWSDASEITDLGSKWKDGVMLLKPANPDLKAKEIPIETFFHKIVMTRDRLRVMEQKINASKGLNDEEKVALQQYITRIYGSLTTFNVLFDSPDSHFKGVS